MRGGVVGGGGGGVGEWVRAFADDDGCLSGCHLQVKVAFD